MTKFTTSLSPFWRAWILNPNVRPIILRNPVFKASRQLSVLSAASRNQLRNQSAHPAIKRWQSITTIPAEETETAIASNIGAPSSRVKKETAPTTSEAETLKREEPAYEITFTCKPCQTRTTHKISKQGYHKGTILITCPDCKNRHLICDHLKIFEDKSTTIEDILKEKGESIKRGTLGAEGGIEFWDDGTTTDRNSVKADAKPESLPDLEIKTQPPVP